MRNRTENATMERRKTRNEETTQTDLAAIWLEHHRYLLNVAYRMLGSVSEAEDVVQDAFAKLLRIDITEIDDLRGWLVVAVSRRCLDELRSARSKREVYVGPWLPEPVVEPVDRVIDPADRITLDDSVRIAMLLVMERLSPAERAAFVLHDVFQFSFEEVGDIVGRTPAACRQLASRARRHVREETSPARFQTDPADAERIANQFIAAASNGDLQGLLPLLDPEVTGHADGGGVVPASRGPLTGRDVVAKGILGFLKAYDAELVSLKVNGEQGAMVMKDGRLMGIISISIRDGRIVNLHAFANPYKLAYAASVLDTELYREVEPGAASHFVDGLPEALRGGRPN